jgi:hypothetical protein
MSVSSLGLDSSWVDYSGVWNSYVEPQVAPLDQSPCHACRYALIPPVEQGLFPFSGKISYNFHLVPGSLIYGWWISGGTSLQLTNVDMGHKFFQEVDVPFDAGTYGSDQARFPSFTLLPAPHPVVGDGFFSLEAWGVPTQRFVMILGVGEVTNCPVK